MRRLAILGILLLSVPLGCNTWYEPEGDGFRGAEDGGSSECVPGECGALDTACAVGVCNPQSGSCESRPLEDQTPCTDGHFCTVGDVCQSGQCVPGPQRDCNDADSCTRDRCDNDTATCRHEVVERPGAEGHPALTCDNGVDDDCDGETDAEDPDCRPPYALAFDGEDDVVRVTQDTSLLSASHLGVFVDFTTADALNSYAVVASHHSFGSDPMRNRWSFGLEPGADKGLSFSTSNGESQYYFPDLIPLSACYGTRFQLLASVDAETGEIQVYRSTADGSELLVDDASFSGVINHTEEHLIYDMLVGNTADGTHATTFFTGRVRRVVVFNYSAFTEMDRQLLFTEVWKLREFVEEGTDHGFSFPRSDVIDYLDFQVGEGLVVPNLCDNGNGDGVLEGFPADDSQWIEE